MADSLIIESVEILVPLKRERSLWWDYVVSAYVWKSAGFACMTKRESN